MDLVPRLMIVSALVVAMVLPAPTAATNPDRAEQTMHDFLAQGDVLRPYAATRHLDATFGDEHAWMDVVTKYSPPAGFQYAITAAGGSEFVQDTVLHPVLNGERDVIARGEIGRVLLTSDNYVFQPNGLDDNGVARILLGPRRKETLLVAGVMFLDASNADLIRVQGRLAKNPSFAIKNVDVVRTFQRVGGGVMAVALEARSVAWLFGHVATFKMTYTYSEVDGLPIAPAPLGR